MGVRSVAKGIRTWALLVLTTVSFLLASRSDLTDD
jgi:hypothetical protein